MSTALAATEHVLAREQKLHALDGLAAAAAHELGTPLSTITLVTNELDRQMARDDPHREDILLLRSQAQRCREILQKLTRHPPDEDPLHGTLSVKEMLHEAAEPYMDGRTSLRIRAAPAAAAAGPDARQPVGIRRPALAGLPMLALYSVPVAVLSGSASFLSFALACIGFLWLLVSDSVDRVRRFGRRFSGEGRDVDVWEPSPLSAAGRRLGMITIVAAIVLPLAVPAMTPTLLSRFGPAGKA